MITRARRTVERKGGGILPRGGLDFNASVETLIADISRRVPELFHIRTSQLRVSATFNRRRTRSGLLAYLLPLKFEGGSPVQVKRRGAHLLHFAMMPQHFEGREMLYYVYFMLPRFFGLSFRDKLETVVHELYHIHPDFNGDLRRFPGKNKTHGCPKAFDRKVGELTDLYLETGPDSGLLRFLKGGRYQLKLRYGDVHAAKIREPRPQLIRKSMVEPAPIYGLETENTPQMPLF